MADLEADLAADSLVVLVVSVAVHLAVMAHLVVIVVWVLTVVLWAVTEVIWAGIWEETAGPWEEILSKAQLLVPYNVLQKTGIKRCQIMFLLNKPFNDISQILTSYY